MKKRVLAILIMLCMAVSLLPVGVSAVSAPALGEHYLSGRAIDNQSKNNYSWYWAEVVNSYLVETGGGALMRVQYDGSSVLVENYNSAYQLTGSRSIAMELPIFGGFYAGSNYYFLVFGQENYGESDGVEIMRVVKYDRSWNRLGSASVYGANTYRPFDAGSLRMVETGGRLFIHTCHKMYYSDGANHQANMTYTIDISGMNVLDSYYRIWNISEGYVSHSFNQFICTDGSNIYRLDHGDARPRAVVLFRNGVYDSLSNVSSISVFSIADTTKYHYNHTGVTIGGMELSNSWSNVLVAGSSKNQSLGDASEQRNIFVSVTAKDFGSTTTKWITRYGEDSGVSIFTPHMTKINDDQFLLMWEEKSSELGTYTRMVTINGNGDMTSDKVYAPVRLSDCKPIALSNGCVAWYVCPNDSTLELCTIDPNRVSELMLKIQSPKSITMSEGKTAAFTVKASSLRLRYQWQYQAPGSSEWKDSTLSTAREATLKVGAKLARNGYQYRCIVTDWKGIVATTKPAKLTVQPLHFTEQPKAKTANYGEKVSFTVKAAGTGLKYQWQFKTSGGSWKNTTFASSKSATLTVTASEARDGRQYRCRITDNLGNSINSSAAKLTTQKMKVTRQPKAVTANYGEKVKFTAKATGLSCSYQWQYKDTNGSWKNTNFTTSKRATLTIQATKDRNGKLYRCKITDSAGNVVTTAAVKLTTRKMAITTQPKSTTATAGTTVKLTVKATGYSLKYQWQYKTPGGTWKNSPATGAKTAVLKIPATMDRNGNAYRCVITDSASTKITSKTVKLTVKR